MQSQERYRDDDGNSVESCLNKDNTGRLSWVYNHRPFLRPVTVLKRGARRKAVAPLISSPQIENIRSKTYHVSITEKIKDDYF